MTTDNTEYTDLLADAASQLRNAELTPRARGRALAKALARRRRHWQPAREPARPAVEADRGQALHVRRPRTPLALDRISSCSAGARSSDECRTMSADLAHWQQLAERYGLPIPGAGQELASAITELAVALIERFEPILQHLENDDLAALEADLEAERLEELALDLEAHAELSAAQLAVVAAAAQYVRARQLDLLTSATSFNTLVNAVLELEGLDQ